MAEPILNPEFEPLLKAARPTVYQTNAFRMIGVAVDTSVAEIGRKVQKVEMMLKFGVGDQALPGLLPPPSKPSLAALQDAKQRLGDPQTRLIEEFFWFWPEEPGGSKTDLALQALERRDLQSAADIWLNRSRNPTDTGSIHNLAVLNHLQALETAPPTGSNGAVAEGLWIQAWRYWRTLVDHDPFWKRLANRIHELDDPRLTSQATGQIRSSLISSILQIDLSLAVSAAEAKDFARAGVHMKVMVQESSLPAGALRKQTEQSLEYVRTWIKHRCASADVEISANVDQTDQILKRFLQDARPKLEILNCLLGAGDRLRDAEHDQVAQTVRDNMVAFGNKTEDWKACEELLCAIQPLAVSPSIKSKIADDLEKVRENREFNTCWFCKENKPDEKAAAIVDMFGNVTQTPTLNGTHYEWRHLPVKVPRCRQCRRVHRGRRIFAAAAAGMAACIVAAVVGWDASTYAIPAFFVTLTTWIGTVVAQYIGWAGKIRVPDRGKLLVLQEMAKRDHRAIAQLKSQQWAFGKTPPQVTTQASGSAVGKVAAWVGVFALLTWVFSALADLTPSTSTPVQTPPPVVSTQPSIPAASDTAGRPNTPITEQEGSRPNGVSGVTSTETSDRAGNAYIESLHQEIEANKVQIETLSASFEQCQQTLAYYNGQISADRQRLDQMESDSKLGQNVDEAEYESIRTRHNSNVRLHNSELESCRAIGEQHDALVDATNAKIHEYNNLIGAK